MFIPLLIGEHDRNPNVPVTINCICPVTYNVMYNNMFMYMYNIVFEHLISQPQTNEGSLGDLTLGLTT